MFAVAVGEWLRSIEPSFEALYSAALNDYGLLSLCDVMRVCGEGEESVNACVRACGVAPQHVEKMEHAMQVSEMESFCACVSFISRDGPHSCCRSAPIYVKHSMAALMRTVRSNLTSLLPTRHCTLELDFFVC